MTSFLRFSCILGIDDLLDNLLLTPYSTEVYTDDTLICTIYVQKRSQRCFSNILFLDERRNFVLG